MTTIIGVIIAIGIVLALAYTLLQPRYAFLLVLLFFPLEQLVQAYVPMLMRVPWLLNVAVAAAAGTAAVMHFVRRQHPFMGLNNAQTWAVAGLWVLMMFGILWTPAFDVAWEFAIVQGLPYWFLMAGILPLLIRDLDDFRRMLVPYMIFGAIISFLILINPNASVMGGRLTLEFAAASGEMFRGNPLVVSELGCLVAVVAALLVTDRHSTSMLAVRAACFLAGTAVMLASGSRGQAVAMVVAIVFLIPFAYRVRDPRQFVIMAASGMFVLVLGLLAVKLFVSDETAARWTGEALTRNTRGRFEMSWNMVLVLLEHPGAWLFGLGTNSYSGYFPFDESKYPHNLVGEVLTHHGVVGFALLCVSLWAAWRACLWLWKANRDQAGMRSAAAIVGAFALVNLLQSLKQGTFTSIPTPFYFFLVACKIATAERMGAAARRGTEHVMTDEEYAAALAYTGRG